MNGQEVKPIIPGAGLTSGIEILTKAQLHDAQRCHAHACSTCCMGYDGLCTERTAKVALELWGALEGAREAIEVSVAYIGIPKIESMCQEAIADINRLLGGGKGE